MSFKKTGNLFSGFGEIFNVGSRFKSFSSLEDMPNILQKSFGDHFGIKDGVSQYAMEELKAKTAIMGLNDSLAAQTVAMAKDAAFTAKAASGKLTFGKALEKNIGSIEDVGDALIKSGKLSGDTLTDLKEDRILGGEVYENKVKKIINDTEGLADTIIDVESKTATHGSAIIATFKGMAAEAAILFKTLATNPVTWIIGAGVAAAAMLDYLDPSYEKLKTKSDSSYSQAQNTQSEADSLKTELGQIDEKIKEINSQPLTLASEAELGKLQTQRKEAEQLWKLKQDIANAEKLTAASDAANTMNAKSATNKVVKEQYDKLGGFSEWFSGTSLVQSDSPFWRVIRGLGGQNGGLQIMHDSMMVTDTDAVALDIDRLKQLQTDKEKLMSWFNSDTGKSNIANQTDLYKSKISEIKDLDSKIGEYSADMATRQSNITQWVDAMTDDNGKALNGYENQVKTLKDELNELTHFNTAGMSEAEKTYNSIDKFFGKSNSANIKEYLSSLASANKLTEGAISGLGLTSDNFDGAALGDVVRYFNDIAQSANKAAEATSRVDGSLSGVSTAFESANAGDDFVTMSDYLDKAKELFDQGLTGTDDFQTVAEMISDGIDSSAETFAGNYENLKRYFTKDDDGNLTETGVRRFAEEFANLGQTFKTTGEAAKAMGLSAPVFEALMGRMHDYAMDTSVIDQLDKSSVKLVEGRTAIEGLKEAYKGLSDASKKQLQLNDDRLDGWDKALEQYEQDMSTLDPTVVARITFEYDKASLQQKIDEAQLLANYSGNSEDMASVLAAKEMYNQRAEQEIGFNYDGQGDFKIPVEYIAGDDTIATLQRQLQSASDSDKVKIQMEIGNIQDAQRSVLDSFTMLHPEINADSSLEEVTGAWNDFVSSTEGQEIMARVTANSDEAKKAIADLLGISVDDLNIDVNANDNASDTLNQVKEKTDSVPAETNTDLNATDNASQSANSVSEAVNAIPFEHDVSVDARVNGLETGLSAMQTLQSQISMLNSAPLSVEGRVELENDIDSTIEALQSQPAQIQAALNIEGLSSDEIKSGIADGSIEIPATIGDIDLSQLGDLNGVEIPITANDQVTSVLNEIQGTEVGDKVTQIIAEDGYSSVVSLWNTMSVDPKFATLSAEDQASLVVQTYNSLSAEDKQSLITQSGGEATQGVASAVNTAINSIPQSHSSSITQNGASNVTSQASSAASAVNSIPASKHSTITITTVKETINKVVNWIEDKVPGHATTKAQDAGIGGADGTAHRSGTAYFYGSAFSQGSAMWQHYRNASHSAYTGGNWGLQHNERGAMINELGGEIIVRNGKWMMLNDGYPTLTNLKAGDIIFNHKQTEEILKNGSVTGSHAKLVGSSHSSGTVPTTFIGSAFASGSGDEKEKTFGDKLSDFTDWVERFIKEIERSGDRLETQFERLADPIAKTAKMYESLANNNRQIDANRQASNRYQSHANWIAQEGGLSYDILNKIHYGTLDLEEISDEETKKLISSYQDYYDKANECADKVEELINKQAELVQKTLDGISDYADMMTGVLKAGQDVKKTLIELNDARGFSAVSGEVKQYINDMIDGENQKKTFYQQQHDSYSKEIENLISAGYMQRWSKEYYEAHEKLNGFAQAVYESELALYEYKEQLRDLDFTELQYTIDGISRFGSTLSDSLSLKEKQGKKITESDYQKQITNNNKEINANYQLRQRKLSAMSTLDVNSKSYQDLAKDVSEIDKDIYNLLEDNEELKESIREVRWDSFNKAHDDLDNLINDTDSLRKLLNDDAFIDPKGILTAEGAANIALIMQGMNAAKKDIANYTAGLKKLDQELKNGVISQSKYDEEQRKFLDAIQDSAGSVEDYKDSLLELHKKQMQTEVDALQKSINKRKEALKAKQEYYNYDKKIRSQSKDVNMIKAQISALEGVNNVSAQAELKRLKADLADKQEELDDTKKDHADDMRIQGYDKMSDDLDENLQKTLENITYNADAQEQVIQEMLNKVVDMYGQAYGKINEIINNTGFKGGSDFTSNISSIKTQGSVQSQVNNATSSQGSTKPSSSASNINTGAINNNSTNNKIEQEINKGVSTTNRKVASLTITPASISIQKGNSQKISYSVKPNDAANKSVVWASSNRSVASVSAGVVKGLSAGTAIITCTTADGGKLQKKCTVKVTNPPESPKPKPLPNTSQPQQSQPYNGIPFSPLMDSYPKDWLDPDHSITDRLKYHNFDSSFGARDVLFRHWFNGQSYTGSSSQNSSLINMMRSAGYKKGTKQVGKDGLDWIHDGEIIVRPSDGGILIPLKSKDGVINPQLTSNLMKIASNPEMLSKINNTIAGNLNLKIPTPSLSMGGGSTQNMTEVTIKVDKIFEVQSGGNVDKDFAANFKKHMPDFIQEWSKVMSSEIRKSR